MKDITKDKNSKKIRINSIILLFLILFIVFIGMRQIGPRNLSEDDAQIISELSQVRTYVKAYYYEEGTYDNFKTSDRWESIADQIPSCSVSLLEDTVTESASEYQINTSKDGKSYAVWAPLCNVDTEKESDFLSKENLLSLLPFASSDINNNLVYFCIDSTGDVGRHEKELINSEAVNCIDLFDE